MGIVVYQITAVVVIVTFSLLGWFVYTRDIHSKLYRDCFLFSVLVALWTFGFLLTMFDEIPYDLALFFSRVSHAFGVIIPISFYQFTTSLIGKTSNKQFSLANYLFTGFLSVGYVLTPWFIKDVKASSPFPYYPVAGPLYPIFIIYWVLLAGYTLYLLFLEFKQSRGDRRQQIKYFFMGQFIGWVGAALLFPLIFNILLEPVTYVVLPLYSVLTTYAIVRHQLMDIEVIIKRTVVFAGLVGSVVAVVSLVAFVSQDVLVRFVQIPKWLSNVLAAMIVAALYGPLRNWLVNTTDRYLFQKKYDYKELLKKFTDEVMLKVDLKQLLETTVKTLTDLVKLDGCSLLLLNKDARQYELAAAQGANGRQVALEEQEPLITFLRKTHEPIGTEGELGKIRFPEAVTKRLEQLQARLCLPLYVHEELKGVLCLGKKKSDEEFTRDDLDILLPLSRTLGIAVSNAQLFDDLAKTQAEAAQNEKLAVIGTLSAGINHEICNPLGIVKAQCEAFLLDQEDGILIGKSTQEVQERSTAIMRGAVKQIDRATAITQKLSNFAKPIKEPSAQPMSVAQELDEVLILVGHDLQLEKIDVRKEIQPDLPPIVADRRQIQEVLFNLIRNAGQAIKAPGTITIRAFQQEAHVRIEIADTGVGIPPDKLGKIYDPFFTTKEPGKGTGLGLFIVRQIVERNKGRISVESTVGLGTTFTLEFPAAKGATVTTT